MQSNLLTTVNARKVSLTVLFLALCVLRLQTANAQTIIQQSNCFTITINSTSSNCAQNNCGSPSQKCSDCYVISIQNTGCPGGTLKTFTFASSLDQIGDCRTICGGDFNVSLDWCSFAGPRTLTYGDPNGIPYTSSGKFFLCRHKENAPAVTYTISCGCACSGSQCTDAKITFP